MKVSFCPNIQFCSNTRTYKAKDGNPVGTYTRLFRSDLEWERFNDFIVKHFKNKENVQFIQFASSDGSEAYTQIITLLENHNSVDKFFPIKAFDIDEEIYNASKSGLLNINNIDKLKFAEHRIDFNKYFQKTNKTLNIQNDKEQAQTYKVSKQLRDKVDFHNADMFDVIKNLKDDSNTVVMCRNVLFFLSDRQIDNFTNYLAFNLKKGSLFVTGEHDEKINKILEIKGFIRVMPNVYMQS